ncbi:MAG: aldo/keto reductase [Planctomycetota bacterium]|nr:aldo/keto reductase [Planctomycetota bacterium]
MLPTRPLTKLGIEITRLGLGTLPMGPLQRGLLPAEGAKVIRAAVEGGINFLDTAALYRTYEHIRQGLAGWQGKVVIATKTHARQDGALARQHIEEARRGLDRETIDIFLCHCARTDFDAAEWQPTLDALMAAKARGQIKMIGVSAHLPAAVRSACRHPEIEVIHPLYNISGLGLPSGGREDMRDAIQQAHASGRFVYAMKALAGGHLLTQREAALRFALAEEALASIAVGMVSMAEVEWNLRFFQNLPLSAELSQKTALTAKRLTILEFICRGCGECVKGCVNNALRISAGKAKVEHGRCLLCGYCAPRCPVFAIRVV